MFEGSCGRTNGSIHVSSSYNNKLNEKVSRLSSAPPTSPCLWFRLQCVGVGDTVPRCMGNAYFFHGGGELERYCVKSIITCVWKAGAFVGSRPCPERIFQDLLVGVVGNNEKGEPPRVRGTSWENMPAACRRDVHVRARASACARRRKGADWRIDLIWFLGTIVL